MASASSLQPTQTTRSSKSGAGSWGWWGLVTVGVMLAMVFVLPAVYVLFGWGSHMEGSHCRFLGAAASWSLLRMVIVLTPLVLLALSAYAMWRAQAMLSYSVMLVTPVATIIVMGIAMFNFKVWC
jgi:hypothetical protein